MVAVLTPAVVPNLNGARKLCSNDDQSKKFCFDHRFSYLRLF